MVQVANAQIPHWLLVQPPNHESQFLCTKTAGKLSGWPSPRGVQAFRRPFLWISWIWCFAVTRQRTTARQGETCCQAIRDPLATFIGHVISLFRRKPRKFTGLSSSGLTVLPAKLSFHHETLAILPNIMEKRTGYMRFHRIQKSTIFTWEKIGIYQGVNNQPCLYLHQWIGLRGNIHKAVGFYRWI